MYDFWTSVDYTLTERFDSFDSAPTNDAATLRSCRIIAIAAAPRSSTYRAALVAVSLLPLMVIFP